MNLYFIKKGAILLFLILLTAIAGPVKAAAMTPEEILQDIRQRSGLANGSYVLEMKITSYRKQAVDTASVKVYISKRRQMVTFTAPERSKNEYYLVNGYNTWMYQTGLKRPIRISAQQKLFGDAGIAEAAGIDYVRDYKIVQTAETESQYQFDLKALDPRTAYQQVSLWIDKNGLFLRKSLLKTVNGQPLKELTYRDHQFIDGHEMATTEVKNILQQKGNRTVMEYTGISSRELPDQAFDPLLMDKFHFLVKD